MKTLNDYFPLPQGIRQYNNEFIAGHRIIKIDENEDSVTIAHSGDATGESVPFLKRFHGKKLREMEFPRKEIDSRIALLLSAPMQEQVDTGDDHSFQDSLEKSCSTAPWVNLAEYLILDAQSRRVTDIHIEPRFDGAAVRFRKDGVLSDLRNLSTLEYRGLVNRLKVLARLEIMERRRPQEGQFTLRNSDISSFPGSCRISVLPGVFGESVSIRILGGSTGFLSLDDLGIPEDGIAMLRTASRASRGIYIISGPTGCGKTTTLHSLLRELDDRELKVITIEDPVEYVISDILQLQVDEEAGLGFDQLFKRVLRHDPDIIMLGEIRDRVTAGLAVRAALSGHLILSTLHTESAGGIIPRLINLGVEEPMLADTLRGCFSQRLIPRLCPECKVPDLTVIPDPAVFGIGGAEEKCNAYLPSGCVSCGFTGYMGRELLWDGYLVDESLRNIIRNGDRQQLSEILDTGGTMLARGMEIARQGLSPLNHVLRKVG